MAVAAHRRAFERAFRASVAPGEVERIEEAARLTGWRIDIKSETQLAEEEAGYNGEEWAEGEWVENEAGEMVWQPAEGGEAVSASEWTQAATDEVPADGASAADAPADGASAAEADAGDQAGDAEAGDAEAGNDEPAAAAEGGA